MSTQSVHQQFKVTISAIMTLSKQNMRLISSRVGTLKTVQEADLVSLQSDVTPSLSFYRACAPYT